MLWNYKKILNRVLNRPFFFFHFFFLRWKELHVYLFSNRENFQNNFTFHHSRKKVASSKKWNPKRRKIYVQEERKDDYKILKNLHVDVSRCFDKVIVTSETGTESKLRKLARSEKRSTILQEEEALTNRFNLPRDHLLFAVYRTWCYFLVTRQTCNRNFSWIAVLAKAKAHPLGNWD